MYQKYFGFKERPFKLVPNPAYLFMSEGHEEAMAHLAYSVSQGDGFVEIIGEVGTGKTTICRAFIEGLSDDIRAAYIFNPKLNPFQLLRTINEELGIESNSENIKDLIDILNSYLMQQKAEGKKVIIVIDEAQNLSHEVLEQLRLLSNLETNTTKLLQIILAGQPELRDMLDSYELRQLGQRITLSYNLRPLTQGETKEYINHRIRIASQNARFKISGVKISGSALRAVYRYSVGIPRLINMACDRAFLTAFGLNRKKITGSIAKVAISELAGRGAATGHGNQPGKVVVGFLSVLCFGLILFILFRPGVIDNKVTIDKNMPVDKTRTGHKQSSIDGSQKAGKEIPREIGSIQNPGPKTTDQHAEQGLSASEDVDEGIESAENKISSELVNVDLVSFLKDAGYAESRNGAMMHAIGQWHEKPELNPSFGMIENESVFFQLAAQQNGLSMLIVENDFKLIKKMNLPVIMKIFVTEDHSTRYMTVVKMDGGVASIAVGNEGETIKTPISEILPLWSKLAFIPWKNFLNCKGKIPLTVSEDSVIILKALLIDAGYRELDTDSVYDRKTRKAVMEFQEKKGIKIDGVVGPITKIMLYNEKNTLKIPHIISESTDG